MDVNITYIWHDCFIITLPNCVVITDFWKEEAGSWMQCDFPDFLHDIDSDTPLNIFVSHHHKDHFNRKIFLWAEKFRNIRYIISKDTAKSVNYLLREGGTYSGSYHINPDNVTVLSPGETFSDDNISTTAFRSTDIGNSYLIECSGIKIFHAGDLNAWLWKDESTSSEIAAALNEFNSILADIRKATPSLDIAFFPVDSRIGTDWWEGAYIFVHTIKVNYFIPMHFCIAGTPEELGERIAQGTDFNLFKNPDYGKYIALTKPGENVNLQFSTEAKQK